MSLLLCASAVTPSVPSDGALSADAVVAVADMVATSDARVAASVSVLFGSP
jgi:hypothetical protein